MIKLQNNNAELALLTFLKAEKGKAGRSIEFINSLIRKTQEGLAPKIIAKEFKDHLINDENPPIIDWIIKREELVYKWDKQIISTEEIYSKGINQEINQLLQKESVKGNLKKLYEFFKDNINFKNEFKNNIKQSELPLICVEAKLPNGLNVFELLDGAHRFINLLRKDMTQINVILGKRNF